MKYTIESCHELGVNWRVTAPVGLREEEIEALMEIICNWTDDPSEDTVKDALQCMNGSECDDYAALDESRIELYQELKAYPKVVHRDMFTQSFQAVKGKESV